MTLQRREAGSLGEMDLKPLNEFCISSVLYLLQNVT